MSAIKKIIFCVLFIALISYSEDKDIAKIIFTSAMRDLNKKRYKPAIEKLNKALLQYEHYTQAYYYLGRVYELTRKEDDAIDSYKKAKNMLTGKDTMLNSLIKPKLLAEINQRLEKLDYTGTQISKILEKFNRDIFAAKENAIKKIRILKAKSRKSKNTQKYLGELQNVYSQLRYFKGFIRSTKKNEKKKLKQNKNTHKIKKSSFHNEKTTYIEKKTSKTQYSTQTRPKRKKSPKKNGWRILKGATWNDTGDGFKTKKQGYGAIESNGMFDFSHNATLRLDIKKLTGGLTIQVIQYDSKGNFIDVVVLVDDYTKNATLISKFAKANINWSKNVRKIKFKIWLDGINAELILNNFEYKK